MKPEPQTGITRIEVEMVIRDKNGNIKHIDHEVKQIGKNH